MLTLFRDDLQQWQHESYVVLYARYLFLVDIAAQWQNACA